MALSAHWNREGLISEVPSWKEIDDSGPILVISGSCSPVTSGQISYALSKGFKEVAIDTEQLAYEGVPAAAIEKYAEQAIEYIKDGHDVLIHTSRGNEDIRVSNSDAIFRARGIPKTETSAIYGTALGMIAKIVAERTKLKRIIVAGGDTSSHAARAMGVESVEMVAPLSPGSPLCKAHAPTSAIDGVELNFKGGQVGKEDYFVIASARSKYNQMPASTTSGIINQ
jgi:3-oxoisoapionate kinase